MSITRPMKRHPGAAAIARRERIIAIITAVALTGLLVFWLDNGHNLTSRAGLSAEDFMPDDDETTGDPVIVDRRNLYKVELWTSDDKVKRMLFAGTVWTRRARSLPTKQSDVLQHN